MERVYAPWRKAYLEDEEMDDKVDCIFCYLSRSAAQDRKHKVFYRDSHCFAVMNRFPYTPGHFMIIPHFHADSPRTLPVEIWSHLHTIGHHGTELLMQFGALGVNYGINIKEDSGAGIPAHLHLHLVPRRRGDTNFITTIGETRVYGLDFEEVFLRISSLARSIFPQP